MKNRISYNTFFRFRLLSILDWLYVSLYCRLYLRSSKEAQLKLVKQFSDIEDDTVWQLFHSFGKIPTPRLKTIVFQQIVEEVYHAEEFLLTYRKMGGAPVAHGQHARMRLFENQTPVWKLLAYCHIGEAEAEMRFNHIQKNLKKGVFRDSINRVLADEVGHVSLASNMLKNLDADNSTVRSEFIQIFWQRRKQSVIRLFKSILGVGLSILLTCVYFALGPFAMSNCKRRLKQPPESSLRSFEEVEI